MRTVGSSSPVTPISVTYSLWVMRRGLVPTFNSLNQNTGYDIDHPIVLANLDVIDIGVRVREIAA